MSVFKVIFRNKHSHKYQCPYTSVQVFCNNFGLVHELSVRRIAKYLTITSTYLDFSDVNIWLTKCGVVYRPGIEKFIECLVDADFTSAWDQVDSDNEENSMSRTRYVIIY